MPGIPEGQKLATMLRTTREKGQKQKRKKIRYKHLDKPASTMSSNVYTDDIITRTVAYVTYGTLLWFSSLQMVAFLDRCRSVMAIRSCLAVT